MHERSNLYKATPKSSRCCRAQCKSSRSAHVRQHIRGCPRIAGHLPDVESPLSERQLRLFRSGGTVSEPRCQASARISFILDSHLCQIAVRYGEQLPIERPSSMSESTGHVSTSHEYHMVTSRNRFVLKCSTEATEAKMFCNRGSRLFAVDPPDKPYTWEPITIRFAFHQPGQKDFDFYTWSYFTTVKESEKQSSVQ